MKLKAFLGHKSLSHACIKLKKKRVKTLLRLIIRMDGSSLTCLKMIKIRPHTYKVFEEESVGHQRKEILDEA